MKYFEYGPQVCEWIYDMDMCREDIDSAASHQSQNAEKILSNMPKSNWTKDRKVIGQKTENDCSFSPKKVYYR